MSMDFGAGEFTDAATMRGRDWPALTQFCVIIENRVGSLNQLMQHLERQDVRIIALSIVDTIDVAIARVMLDRVERGRELFELSGFTFFEIEVLGVQLPEQPQPFVAVCSALLQAEVNVNYMYPLLYRHGGHSAIAVHVEDMDTATRVLRDKGFQLLGEDDLLNDDEHFG
ncbi:MAG: acetolactate synthase [Planctomycetota bacterium]|nr:acetolactate synthase [Planctomycetota bacterium]MDA1163512.1 acetolactate synthase [Planctomycetota bacterium]